MDSKPVDARNLDFWKSRAPRGETAGTEDFILKQLEVKLILETIHNGASVLDVGCGNGATLVTLALEKRCTGLGIDFAPELLELARAASQEAGCDNGLEFREGSVPGLSHLPRDFEYALTERCLINLDSEATQRQAFLEILSHVRPGGAYLMIESSVQGLERTNALRRILDLEEIRPPWHNVFLDEEAVSSWGTGEIELERVVPFSSTYHFLSRVVYARLAADKGEDLRYDSDINLLSCRLPIIGNFGPARLWLWRRRQPGGKS